MTTAHDGLVVARTTFFLDNKLVGAGEVWAVDDPVVKRNPAAFRPLQVRASVPAKEPSAPKRVNGRFVKKSA